MAGATRIKHCGITGLDDAERAVEAGAWALGVILWPGSPRACDVAMAAGIARRFRRRVEVCGVFVDQPLDEVADAVEAASLTMVQLHGDEGPAFCAEVRRRTGARVAKAARIRAREDVQALRAFRGVDLHLVDAHVEGLRGGTGQTVDWTLLGDLGRDVPLVLSGGLRPGNVGEAITAVRPWAVDVASGTEAAPGAKDPELLVAFGAAVRAADEALAAEEAA